MGSYSLVTLQQEYDELKPKVLAGMIWMDDDENSVEQKNKWFPEYKRRFDELTRLERLIRNGNV